MRGILFCFLMFVFKTYGQDVSEGTFRLIRVCELCTCSEIPDSEVGEQKLVLNIQCSEQDRIDDVSDLDKILWPENPNHLTVNAAFEGLGISTLGKLPPNPQVETLRLTNNAIETYWPDPFSDLPVLKKLSLAQNKLSAITPDLFTAIDSLVELDLSYNQISDLNSLEFKNLQKVKKLNLQSNHLNKIPIESLQPMTALEDLDLSKNGIFDLLLQRSGAEVFPNLRRLNLGGNRIRSVMKDSFPEKNNLEYLDLSNNIIEMVEPDSFLSCPNLREINLSQNNITLVFAFPPSVQVAILRMNALYHWPEFPAGITYIDVSYNRLSTLYDENNAQFDNLEVLNVGGNQITYFNIENKLPKLFDLDISYNYITEVPKSINSQLLPSLEKLRLDGNPIENIYFKNIIALKTLYMYDMNKVEVVGDKAFSNVLGRDSEREEDSCFSLYLANCPSLGDIKEGAFDMTSLCLLDISRNNLTSLSRGLTRWSRVTDGVNLQHNPWRCACALQWLLDDLLPAMYRDNSTLLTELRCGSPRAYAGLRLVHFYNWTERAMCSDSFMRSDPYDNYMLEPSTSQNMLSNATPLSLILGGCILATMVIAIALSAYLLITRKKHRIRQAALNRKRQSAIDMRNSMNQKEQIAALNKV